MSKSRLFISTDKKHYVELTPDNKLFVTDSTGTMTFVELANARSTREKLLAIDENYLADYEQEIADAVLSCKEEMIISELMHTVAPVFRRSIRSGEDLGDSLFIYKGVVVEGGEATQLHNLMVGLQNLFGYVDNEGLWSHKSMMKYAERDTTIPYWHRYAVRALIAYSKTVNSLYIHGINELSVEELRAVYTALRGVMWQEDENKKHLRAVEDAERKAEAKYACAN